MVYRIFSNDRGLQKGVKMYSCLDEIEASTIVRAKKIASSRYPDLGPLALVRWPPSKVAKVWLDVHVGPEIGGKRV